MREFYDRKTANMYFKVGINNFYYHMRRGKIPYYDYIGYRSGNGADKFFMKETIENWVKYNVQ